MVLSDVLALQDIDVAPEHEVLPHSGLSIATCS
ncbi:hypothetical protein SAMN05421505_1116 [Sinosporangium album]|uniref:SapB/AmfS family lantipeptide n=1 Tax=Sinosporangium album TaxID=504805 RepID=A0A1G7ZCN0_9ACTN|nr:SapB/AmfS family lantipeptide [Sinosporangium album]SDH06502.1 hypothetical protein SAMN05421505_1116 [Sinosporangium album]